MDLNDIRKELDSIDNSIVDLFNKRIDLVEEVAKYKKANHLPVLDSERERDKKYALASLVSEDRAGQIDSLFGLIFDMSRANQHRSIDTESQMVKSISEAIDNTPNTLPQRPMVACQGVEGSYSQAAADKLFPSSRIIYNKSFEGVFASIEQGLCDYGILPIENSTAGSVNSIYQLMLGRAFYIVKSCRVKVDHCLLGVKNARIEDIEEIYSHEQAIAQCSNYLKGLNPNIKIIPCQNTAIAAKNVFELGNPKVAAIGSRACAGIYDLDILKDSIVNQDNNYTRFICISKKLEIYPASNRTSLMMVLPNTPGALYKVLAYFNALRVNLIKLESRPLPHSNFEFMFYFDLECSIYSKEYLDIFRNLKALSLETRFLGTYSEEV